MSNNINISVNNADSLSAINQILAKMGLQAEVEVKPINYGKLYIVSDHEVQCIYCKKVFDPSELSEQQLKESTASGLCPSCNEVLAKATAINNRQTNRIKNTKNINNSAGGQCREYILQAMPKFTAKNMQDFCDEEYSKITFDINYPLFKDITNVPFDKIKNEIRKVRGFNRYNLKIYTILGRDYILCNDLYERHVLIFRNALIKLGFIDGEIIEEVKHVKRRTKLSLKSEENIEKNDNNDEMFEEVTFDTSESSDILKVKKRKKSKEELLQEIDEQKKIDHERRAENAKKHNITFGRRHKKVTETNLMDNFN